MAAPSPARRHRFRVLVAVVLTLVVAVPISVIAAHNFTDVPDDNQFHGSISWLADNDVTFGCNPPANDEFCPDDNVTREQMAAFMRRLAQTFGNTGAQVTDFNSPIDVNSGTPVELISIEVAPKAQVNVTLQGHVNLEKGASAEGRYDVEIRRGSCSGTVVGFGNWRPNAIAGATFTANTVSVTGFDVVSTATTYVLCASEQVASPDATAYARGITASWSPEA